jgi:transcriptional regulator with XRE-family HTH domain
LKYARPEGLGAIVEGDPPDDYEEEVETVPTWTINQLVAYNVQRARKARGWSQEYLGHQLERYTGKRWTNAAVSAAERSWNTGRVRRFDANELASLSSIFEMPIDFFFLPPDEEEFQELALRTSTPGDSFPYEDDSYRPMDVAFLVNKLNLTTAPHEYVDRLELAINRHTGKSLYGSGAGSQSDTSPEAEKSVDPDDPARAQVGERVEGDIPYFRAAAQDIIEEWRANEDIPYTDMIHLIRNNADELAYQIMSIFRRESQFKRLESTADDADPPGVEAGNQ